MNERQEKNDSTFLMIFNSSMLICTKIIIQSNLNIETKNYKTN